MSDTIPHGQGWAESRCHGSGRRMKRTMTAALLALALAAPAAQGMTLARPSPGYQGWLAAAKVPLPRGTFTLVSHPCPGGLPCVDEPSRTIYGANADGPVTFFHEVGHQFDYWELTRRDRARFLSLTGGWRFATPDSWDPTVVPSPVSEPAGEVFADAYALCAVKRNWTPRVHYFRGVAAFDLPELTGGRMRRICTLIVKAYWR